MTNIVIHRQAAEDANFIFFELCSLFNKYFKDHVTLNYRRRTIDILDTSIHFRCGNIERLAGMIVNYYNTDNSSNSLFLKQSADKVGGKEFKDVTEILSVLAEIYQSNKGEKE